MDIEAEAPVDVVDGILRGGGKRQQQTKLRIEESVGDGPQQGSDEDAQHIEIENYHVEHQLDNVPHIGRVSEAPCNGADAEKCSHKNEKRRVVSCVRRLPVVLLLIHVIGSVHFLWVDDKVEDFPDGRLKVEGAGLE